MSLTRSSVWTTKTGTLLRVRDMTIVELTTAILYIEQLQMQEYDSDPYAVQTMCAESDCCTVLPEPNHKIGSACLDDWYTFLNAELERRAALIEKRLFHPKKPPTFTERLVKLLRFW